MSLLEITKEKGQVENKEKTEPVETIIICGTQDFGLHNQSNPVEIRIDDDQIINLLKKHKGDTIKSTRTGLLFLSSVEIDTKQIFIKC